MRDFFNISRWIWKAIGAAITLGLAWCGLIVAIPPACQLLGWNCNVNDIVWSLFWFLVSFVSLALTIGPNILRKSREPEFDSLVKDCLKTLKKINADKCKKDKRRRLMVWSIEEVGCVIGSYFSQEKREEYAKMIYDGVVYEKRGLPTKSSSKLMVERTVRYLKTTQARLADERKRSG